MEKNLFGRVFRRGGMVRNIFLQIIITEVTLILTGCSIIVDLYCTKGSLVNINNVVKRYRTVVIVFDLISNNDSICEEEWI